jgi:hypothetical protein
MYQSINVNPTNRGVSSSKLNKSELNLGFQGSNSRIPSSSQQPQGDYKFPTKIPKKLDNFSSTQGVKHLTSQISQVGINTMQIVPANQYNSTANIKMKFEKTVNLQSLSKNSILLANNDNGRYKKKPVYQYEQNTSGIVIGKELRSSSKNNQQKISSQSSRNKAAGLSLTQNKNFINN